MRKFGAPNTVLALLCIMYFITYIDRQNLATAGPYIRDEFKLNHTELGQAFAAFGYTYAIFQILGGFAGDKFGARLTLFLCGVIWAAATILTGFVGGLLTLILARLLLGFGEGATFPTSTRAMQNWMPPARRGFAQGITHSFSRLGNSITPPVVAAITIWWNWRAAFVALGLVSLIWVIVWALYFRDNPAEHKGVTAEDLAELPAYGGTDGQAKRKIPWRRLIWRILPVTITYFCYGWTLWVMLNWLPSFFKEGQHLDIKSSALFATAVFLAGVVGDTAGGVLSDGIYKATGNVKLARLSVIIAGFLGSAACLLGVVFGGASLDQLALLLAGALFFNELVIGPIWSVPMDIAPDYAGTAAGIMNTGSAVAAIVSPLAFGKIVDLTGNWVLPFLGSIGLLLLGVVLAFTMHPERKFVEEDSGNLAAVPGKA